VSKNDWKWLKNKLELGYMVEKAGRREIDKTENSLAKDKSEDSYTDLNTILKFGTKHLFKEREDSAKDIEYNDAFIEKLVNRSKIFSTETEEEEKDQI
jgi:hypothetical protein